MSWAVEIGKRIREYREHCGLTQEEFSEKLGVSKTFYGNVERGRQKLSVEKLIFLHNTFQIDLNYLLAGEKAPDSSLLKMMEAIPPEHQYDVEQVMHHIQHICMQQKAQDTNV